MLRRGTKLSTLENVPYDPSAQAYFNSAHISNPRERMAVNQLIVEMKQAGLWQKMDRLYLFSPTSLAAALYCAKTLTQMTAINNPTFSSSGIALDGASQYLTTGYNPTNGPQFTVNSAHYSVYINGPTYSGGGDINMLLGAADFTGLDQFYYFISLSLLNAHLSNSGAAAGLTISSPTGLLIGNRILPTQEMVYANEISNTAAVDSAASANSEIFIGARNFLGSPDNLLHQQLAFVSFGAGLISSEVQMFRTFVSRYQTSLRRSI